MTLRTQLLASMAMISLTTYVTSVRAATLNLAVDSSQSTLSESIGLSASLLGNNYSISSPALSETLSGGAPGNVSPPAHTGYLGAVGIAGNVPGTLTDNGGGFGLSNLSTDLSIPFVGDVSVGIMVPHVSIGLDGPFAPLSAGANTATYDLSGLPLQFDAGQFNYSSSGLLNFIGSGSLTLLSAIGTQNLPAGTHGTLTLAGNHVTLDVPLSMTASLLTVGNSLLGAGIIVTYAGNAVFTGVIPEPSSVILLVVGLMAGLPLIARKLRHS